MTSRGSYSITKTSYRSTTNTLYSIRVAFMQCLCKFLEALGGERRGSSALAGFAPTGGLEPGAAGRAERCGSRHHFEAGDGPAQRVSDDHPQARRRPRGGARAGGGARAARSGVARDSIARLETGLRRAYPTAIRKRAAGVEVEPGRLFGGVEYRDA